MACILCGAGDGPIAFLLSPKEIDHISVSMNWLRTNCCQERDGTPATCSKKPNAQCRALCAATLALPPSSLQPIFTCALTRTALSVATPGTSLIMHKGCWAAARSTSLAVATGCGGFPPS